MSEFQENKSIPPEIDVKSKLNENKTFDEDDIPPLEPLPKTNPLETLSKVLPVDRSILSEKDNKPKITPLETPPKVEEEESNEKDNASIPVEPKITPIEAPPKVEEKKSSVKEDKEIPVERKATPLETTPKVDDKKLSEKVENDKIGDLKPPPIETPQVAGSINPEDYKIGEHIKSEDIPITAIEKLLKISSTFGQDKARYAVSLLNYILISVRNGISFEKREQLIDETDSNYEKTIKEQARALWMHIKKSGVKKIKEMKKMFERFKMTKINKFTKNFEAMCLDFYFSENDEGESGSSGLMSRKEISSILITLYEKTSRNGELKLSSKEVSEYKSVKDGTISKYLYDIGYFQKKDPDFTGKIYIIMFPELLDEFAQTKNEIRSKFHRLGQNKALERIEIILKEFLNSNNNNILKNNSNLIIIPENSETESEPLIKLSAIKEQKDSLKAFCSKYSQYFYANSFLKGLRSVFEEQSKNKNMVCWHVIKAVFATDQMFLLDSLNLLKLLGFTVLDTDNNTDGIVTDDIYVDKSILNDNPSDVVISIDKVVETPTNKDTPKEEQDESIQFVYSSFIPRNVLKSYANIVHTKINRKFAVNVCGEVKKTNKSRRELPILDDIKRGTILETIWETLYSFYAYLTCSNPKKDSSEDDNRLNMV